MPKHGLKKAEFFGAAKEYTLDSHATTCKKPKFSVLVSVFGTLGNCSIADAPCGGSEHGFVGTLKNAASPC